MKESLSKRTIGFTICRILVSLIIIKDLLLYSIYYKELLGPEGIVPLLTYAQILEVLGMEYFFINFSNPWAGPIFLCLLMLSAIAFLFGYRVKASGLILFLGLTTIKLRGLYFQDGADNVIGTMLPLLLLASTYNVWTGKLNNNFKGSFSIIPVLAGLGILFEFCLIYFAAGISKAVQPVWQNGEALYYILRIEDFRASNLNIYLTQSAFLVKFATWFTLFWELTFPFVIWHNRKIRNLYLIMGISLHIGIWMLMRIDNFSFIMLSFYPIFFLDAEYKTIYNKFLKPVLHRTQLKTILKPT